MTRPYGDDRDHLLDELARLDLLLRGYVEEWWEGTRQAADGLGGLYVSDEEIDRLFPATGERRTTGTGDSALRERIRERAREIRARVRATEAEGREPRLVALADRFGLERSHVDALLIALAPELDRKYETGYGYLQDDVTETRPTVDLALRVLYRTATDRLAARSLFARRSPLRRHRLVWLGDDRGRPLLSRRVTVDERVVAFLLGDDDVDDELADAAAVVTPETSLASLPVGADARARLEALAVTDGGSPESPPSGSGSGPAPGPTPIPTSGPGPGPPLAPR